MSLAHCKVASYQLLNVYCKYQPTCQYENTAVFRILSRILDGSTMASHILLSFHCPQKGQELLICSRKHLTADSCLLCCQLQMAKLRKSPGVGFTTKQIYTVGQRCKYLLILSVLGLHFCFMLTHSSRFANSAN